MLHSYLLKGNNFREFLRSDNEHAVMHKFNQLELNGDQKEGRGLIGFSGVARIWCEGGHETEKIKGDTQK